MPQRQLAAATGYEQAGRCLTTSLNLEYGDRDPAISLRVELLKEWWKMWAKSPEIRKRATRAWASIRKRIGNQHDDDDDGADDDQLFQFRKVLSFFHPLPVFAVPFISIFCNF